MNAFARQPLHMQLLGRIAELEEEIRQLRLAFAPVMDWPAAFGLSKAKCKILSALYNSQGTYVTRQQLLHVISGIESEVAIKVIDVHVCKLRQILAPLDIHIETRWGSGYSLTPKSRDRLTAIMERLPS